MNCNHFCNEPFRCWTCARQFYAWAQARTNQPAPRPACTMGCRPGEWCRCMDRGPNFYAHVNVIAPIVTLVQVEAEVR